MSASVIRTGLAPPSSSSDVRHRRPSVLPRRRSGPRGCRPARLRRSGSSSPSSTPGRTARSMFSRYFRSASSRPALSRNSPDASSAKRIWATSSPRLSSAAWRFASSRASHSASCSLRIELDAVDVGRRVDLGADEGGHAPARRASAAEQAPLQPPVDQPQQRHGQRRAAR